MLTCLPQSLCSWNYRIVGAKAGPATLTSNYWTEQGTMTLGSETYAIVKQGPLSGRWTLEDGEGAVVAEAVKPSAMFREFQVDNGQQVYTLKTQAPMGRSFDLFMNDSLVGTIRPAHPFTRRAFIDGGAGMAERDKLFAFWLAALAWRRAQNNS